AVPEPDRPLGQIEIHPYVPRAVLSSDKAGISVSGGRGLMIRFAGCCRPTTGDPIVGYVSRGRGIIVHRRDCRNLPFLSDFKERAIEVVWETRHPGLTRRFRITAKRIPDLFGEVETAVKKIQGHLIEGKLEEDGDRLVGWFTVRMEKPEDGRKIERSVRGVPAILKVQVVSGD
ncbi:MAG TPA: bifunctional (p)ppGpp synthetase/guanosine-3',5'-bis(diphosphate) 3'-pyrophosphohydrolase, partial [Spirochaetia bacterium]|nr:bifunctional (p)ppGpp synthetase/guanosine-3',5'-bis(diphosphate) 3'-pyrophosphohydrolase [Spirochaetia bacterium]